MNSIVKNQAGKLSELFDSTSDVGIILGENQNLDTVAAALGLALVLNSSGKSVQIVSKKVPEVAVSNLFGVDKIKQSFGGVAKMITISIPYHEEIEKVSYNIEGDRLNVNLFAEEQGINLDESQVEYIRQGSNPSLIITVGVPDERELTSFVDPATVRAIHIDTNPVNALMGEVSLIDPSFSSLSEIAAELVREANLGFDQDGYQNFMEGIYFATRGLTDPATSGFAFEAVGFLMQNGAKRPERQISDVRAQIQEQKPRNEDRRDNQGRQQDRRDDRRDDRNRDRNRDRNQNQRRDDRGSNFPQDQLLNQRPPRNQQGNQNPQRNQGNQVPSNQNQNQSFQPVSQPIISNPVQNDDPQDDFAVQTDAPIQGITINDPLNQAPKPYQAPNSNSQTPTSREAQDMDMPTDYVDSSTTEGAAAEPAEIPDDWFLPKVFKGSKKPNN